MTDQDAGDIAAIQADYRDLALRWARAVHCFDEATRLEREHRALYRRLRTTEAGRAAISSLLDDPEPAVRVLAATHSLEWEPDRSTAVLRALAESGGRFAVDALWALRSHAAGQLLSVLQSGA